MIPLPSDLIRLILSYLFPSVRNHTNGDFILVPWHVWKTFVHREHPHGFVGELVWPRWDSFPSLFHCSTMFKLLEWLERANASRTFKHQYVLPFFTNDRDFAEEMWVLREEFKLRVWSVVEYDGTLPSSPPLLLTLPKERWQSHWNVHYNSFASKRIRAVDIITCNDTISIDALHVTGVKNLDLVSLDFHGYSPVFFESDDSNAIL